MNIPCILYLEEGCADTATIQHKIRKPIFRFSGYAVNMDTTQKSYRFCIEPDASIATLEAALQVVRRLDIELRALRTTATPYGMEVQMRLAAPEEDLLTLCRMRLHNLIGVLPIREMPTLVVNNVLQAVT